MIHQKTSKDALDYIRPLIRSMKEQVYEIIAAYPEGIIAQDIEEYIGNGRSTVTARIRELVLDKRITDSGNRGLTKSGRSAIKWMPICKLVTPLSLAA